MTTPQTTTLDTFAALVRARLKASGMTQTDLARRLGYTTNASVTPYLTGKREPGEALIYRWARALDCSPRELLPERAPDDLSSSTGG